MSALARWCFGHRLAVIVAWVGVLVALAGISNAVKTSTDNSFLLPGTGSANAIQLLQQAVPAQAGDSDTIVWHVDHGSVRDREVQTRISAMLALVARAPEVAAVTSPYAPPPGSRGGGSGSGGQAAISRDGRTAFAAVNFTKRAGNLDKADITRVIALGVGIDYALFIVTRYRRALLSGLRPLDAVDEAASTSGRAVVFAGGTVCIALLGILTLGVGFLDGLALAAAVTVVCTVAAASTLLPALLGVFGVRVISRRQLSRVWSTGGEPAERTSGAWVRWARTVQRRPVAL